MKNIEKFKNMLIEVSSLVPGVEDFLPLENLKDINDKKNAVEITLLDNNLIDVKISIIIHHSFSAKTIIFQLSKAIHFSLKNEGLKVKNVNIYIKGVK